MKETSTIVNEGNKTMKKLLALLVALTAIASAASNASALTSKDNDSFDISIEFINTGNGSITLHDNETGGSEITNLLNITDFGPFTAPSNQKARIKEMWLEIDPRGVYEVHIYTNNLDTDNDGINPGELDTNPIGGNAGSKGIHVVPSNYSALDINAQANFIATYAGIYHQLTVFPVDNDDTTNTVYMLPVKVRSAGELGEKVNELPDPDDPDNEAAHFIELTGDTISEDAWTGELATFSFIPEKQAIDTLNNINFRKKIASTALGTNFTKRQQLLLGVDLLTAGKGDYKGTIYLEMVEN